jgi:hypothetical protein
MDAVYLGMVAGVYLLTVGLVWALNRLRAPS